MAVTLAGPYGATGPEGATGIMGVSAAEEDGQYGKIAKWVRQGKLHELMWLDVDQPYDKQGHRVGWRKLTVLKTGHAWVVNARAPIPMDVFGRIALECECA